MGQELCYDYIDSDPVVPIKLIASDVSNKYLAFLDTGSDGIAIPRELWEKLRLSRDYPVRIQSVMSDDPEILIGMEILGKYIVCFDGIKKRVAVGKS